MVCFVSFDYTCGEILIVKAETVCKCGWLVHLWFQEFEKSNSLLGNKIRTQGCAIAQRITDFKMKFPASQMLIWHNACR